MKNLLCAVLVFQVLMSLGQAQTIGVHGSFVDVQDAGDAYGFGAVLQVPLGDLFFVEGRIARHEGIESSDAAGPLVLNIESDLTPIDVGIGLQAPLGESARFWLSGGMYLMQIESDSFLNEFPVPLEVEDNEGWYVLLGTGFGQDFQIYAEVQYRSVDARFSGKNLPPALAALPDTELHKVSVNVGIRYRW